MHNNAEVIEDNIEDYFTNREELIKALQTLASEPTLGQERIIAIHGSVGSGKSAVLRMLRIFCKKNRIPVALISGRSNLTEIEAMRQLAIGLADSEIKLRSFHAARRKLDPRQKKDGGKINLLQIGVPADELAVTAIGVRWLGPSIKLVLALIDALASLFKRRRLVRDPLTTITRRFLEGIAKYASYHRIVLLIDHLEHMNDLELWLCNWLKNLHPNVLVVAASQEFIGSRSWDDIWPAWATHIKSNQLETLKPDDRRKLVIRLYRAIHGSEPEDDVVEEILAGNTDTPLAIGCEVWVRILGYRGHHDTNATDNVETIVNFLLRRVPRELKPILVAAAIVRFFDQEVLRYLVGGNELEKHFASLASSQLLVRGEKAWTLPTSVREVMNMTQKQTDRARYNDLHTRAREYYKRRLEQSDSQPNERKKWELERLYHEFQLSETHWMVEFRSAIETAFRRNELEFCRSLIYDASGYAYNAANTAWLSAFKTLVEIQQGRLDEARRILEDLRKQNLDPRLRTEVIDSFARIHWLRDHRDEAQRLYYEYLDLCKSQNDLAGQVRALVSLGTMHKRTGKAEQYLDKAKKIADRLSESDAHVKALLDKELADLYRLQGRFSDAEKLIVDCISLYRNLSMSFEQAHAIRTHAMLLVYMGKLYKAKQSFQECISLFDKCAAPERPRLYEVVWPLIGLGDVALGQQKDIEAEKNYFNALNACEGSEFETAVVLGCLADLQYFRQDWDDALDYANRSLNLRKKHKDEYGVGLVMKTKGAVFLSRGESDIALEHFEEGIKIMRACRSFYGEAKFLLGKCQVYCDRVQIENFNGTARSLRTIAEKYGYWDDMARLGYLEGWFTLKASTRPLNNQNLKDAAQLFEQGLKNALQYNIFLLNVIAQRTCEAIQDLLVPQDQEVVLNILRNRWSEGTIEREERVIYEIDPKIPTVEERLGASNRISTIPPGYII